MLLTLVLFRTRLVLYPVDILCYYFSSCCCCNRPWELFFLFLFVFCFIHTYLMTCMGVEYSYTVLNV